MLNILHAQRACRQNGIMPRSEGAAWLKQLHCSGSSLAARSGASAKSLHLLQELSAPSLCLHLHPVHELWSGYALREPRKIFDIRGGHELSTAHAARRETLKHNRLQVCSRGIYGRRVASRAGPNDGQIFHLCRPSITY